jgi:hypothetical protein
MGPKPNRDEARQRQKVAREVARLATAGETTVTTDTPAVMGGRGPPRVRQPIVPEGTPTDHEVEPEAIAAVAPVETTPGTTAPSASSASTHRSPPPALGSGRHAMRVDPNDDDDDSRGEAPPPPRLHRYVRRPVRQRAGETREEAQIRDDRSPRFQLASDSESEAEDRRQPSPRGDREGRRKREREEQERLQEPRNQSRQPAGNERRSNTVGYDVLNAFLS